jgi:NAD(P)-dependent dehydrogenase (short-subunit alcohol dehydrogenase family)
VRAFLISRQPIQRQGTTDDIAEAAIFFASDRSTYMTGQIMCVDGGMLTGNPQPAGGFQEIVARYRQQ